MSRRVPTIGSCGLVQIVRLAWDKSARGGQGAHDRNAVPLGFEVSADQLPGDGELVIVESDWGHRNAFAEPFHRRSRRVPIKEGFSFGCITGSAGPEGLSIRYRYDGAHGGAPDRWYLNCANGEEGLPGRLLMARPGSWVRVCYNGRFSCIDSGTWWYEQTTVNAAWFDGKPSDQVFIENEPTHELRALAELW